MATKKESKEIIYREITSFDEFKNDRHHQKGQENLKYFKLKINNKFENVECIMHWVSRLGFIVLFVKNNENNLYYLLLANIDSSTSLDFTRIYDCETLDKLYECANNFFGINILPKLEEDVSDVIAKLKELVEGISSNTQTKESK